VGAGLADAVMTKDAMYELLNGGSNQERKQMTSNSNPPAAAMAASSGVFQRAAVSAPTQRPRPQSTVRTPPKQVSTPARTAHAAHSSARTAPRMTATEALTTIVTELKSMAAAGDNEARKKLSRYADAVTFNDAQSVGLYELKAQQHNMRVRMGLGNMKPRCEVDGNVLRLGVVDNYVPTGVAEQREQMARVMGTKRDDTPDVAMVGNRLILGARK
jgi:hypothetical protein